MRILALGGTAFVGRAILADARKRDWPMATFNRGITGVDPPGVISIRGDRQSPREVAQLVPLGPWDAVVDTSGYVPRNVLDVARVLDITVAVSR